MMDLTVADAAALLRVSEKTIYRWIQRKAIPAYKIGGQYRFRRQELMSWAGARRVVVMPGSLATPEDSGNENLSLTEALKLGGIYHGVAGQTKAEVLANAVEVMRLPEQVNRTYVLRELLVREDLGSTGVGDGIAIPHIRTPITPDLPHPLAALCFTEEPVEFGALDGKPVSAIIILLSPNVRSHLRLVSILSFVLRDPQVHDALKKQVTPDEILSAVRRAEEQLSIEQDDDGDTAASE